MSVIKDFTRLTDVVKLNFKNLEDDLTLLNKAMNVSSRLTEGGAPKIKVLEPKSFKGIQNSKVIEEFPLGYGTVLQCCPYSIRRSSHYY